MTNNAFSRPDEVAGGFSQSEFLTGSSVADALAGADINQLLSDVAQTVGDTLSADLVLILELGAIAERSCFSSTIAWDQAAAVRVGKQLFQQAQQQPATNERDDVATHEGALPDGIYRPSRTFLQHHGLSDGLFASVPCGQGSLLLFAGNPGEGGLFGKSQASALHAIAKISSLAISRASTELARVSELQQVLQAKQQWEITVDALPQLVCLIDESGRVIRANRTLETWQLGDVTSIRGAEVHAMIHAECADPQCDFVEEWNRVWQQLSDKQFAECSVNNLLPGHEMHLSLFKSDGLTGVDAAEEQERGYALLLIEDVSERKRQGRLLVEYKNQLQRLLQKQSTELRETNVRLETEIRAHKRDKEILAESEQRYACFVENTLTGIYVVRNNRIVFYNKRFSEMFGYDNDYIYQLELHELFPSDGASPLLAEMAKSNGRAVENTVKGVTRAGEQIWLRRRMSMIDCPSELNMPGEPIVLGSIIDVTAQKDAEDGLRCSEHELSILSEKLLQSQEEERKRIAMELHDGIGQSLSGVKLGIENAVRACEHASGQCMARVVDRLRDAIKEVRSISMGLRPSLLDDLGLTVTLVWYCREYQAMHPTVRIELDKQIEEAEVPDSLKVVIFRIFQEALNNIGKHADASNVNVELARKGDALILRVQDDGRGIPEAVLQHAKGLGLSSMKERAKLSSGHFTIETAPDTGTAIQVAWHLL